MGIYKSGFAKSVQITRRWYDQAKLPGDDLLPPRNPAGANPMRQEAKFNPVETMGLIMTSVVKLSDATFETALPQSRRGPDGLLCIEVWTVSRGRRQSSSKSLQVPAKLSAHDCTATGYTATPAGHFREARVRHYQTARFSVGVQDSCNIQPERSSDWQKGCCCQNCDE